MARPESELITPWGKYMCLALGLLFLGKQEIVEPTVEVRTSSRQQAAGSRQQAAGSRQQAAGSSMATLRMHWMLPCIGYCSRQLGRQQSLASLPAASQLPVGACGSPTHTCLVLYSAWLGFEHC